MQNRQKTKFKQTEIGMIPEDWEVKRLGEVADIEMGQSPPGKSYNQRKEGIKFLQGVRTFGEKYPSFDTYTIKVTKKANAGSVLLSVRAQVGDVNITKEDLCIGRGLAGLNMRNKNNEFLYYLLKRFKFLILEMETGSVFGSINCEQIKNLKLPFPKDFYEQRAIAKILSDLDSKIELNQQMNKTLEAIGQAIFKHWFVDFEFPNEEGKPYKSSGGEMVYNEELGKEIPKEWRVGKYSDLVNITTGKGLNKSEYSENGEFVVWGANGELGRTNKFLFNDELILTGRVGTLGTVYIIDGKAWISDNVLVSKAKLKEFFYYAYFTLKSFDLQSLNRGSTQPLITQTDLKNQACLIPEEKILILFYKILYSLFCRIKQLKAESLTLSSIRDSLLPKLMSGKIRVPVEMIKEMEREIEKSV